MIIGLCGFKGSGKTTLAKLMAPTFTRQPFAEPLYKMLETLLIHQGATRSEIDYLFTTGKEESTPYLNGKSPRQALQTLGTEWGRNHIAKTIWLDVWKRKLATQSTSIVVDDVRFLNEAEMLRRHGGIIIKIERPGVELDPQHISELEQMMIISDYVIANDGEPIHMLSYLNPILEGKI
jgi:hypothetical protein